jgi:hypothetical protein
MNISIVTVSRVREANAATSPLVPIEGVGAIDTAGVGAGRAVRGDVGAVEF